MERSDATDDGDCLAGIVNVFVVYAACRVPFVSYERKKSQKLLTY